MYWQVDPLTGYHTAQVGAYTASIWSSPAGRWSAMVVGLGRGSMHHGMTTAEEAQDWCAAQVAAFVTTDRSNGQPREA